VQRATVTIFCAMTQTMYHNAEPRRPELPDPATWPELFEGVLTRRVMAYIIDLVIMSIAASVLVIIGLIAGFLTFGLAWLVLPFAIPLLILAYYAMTLGSPARATLGMQAMDIVLTPARGRPLDGWRILIHPIVFWITVWVAWPLSLIIALVTPRREMVQDLVTGTLMIRRSPMARHWRGARTDA
jgi:uncharacterized RDD family membrane protein YckC